MTISAVQGSTLLDFPGRLSCVLFTQGCPYDCFYCHNRSLIPLQGEREGVDVFDFLTRRRGLLEGVVISGGEPTIHSDLAAFIRRIKELGYAVKLDTNGGNPTMVGSLVDQQLLDYIALDVKASEEAYPVVCGANARWEAVEETLSLLKASPHPFEVRTTVYPTMKGADLLRVSAMIGSVALWRLNRYRIPDLYKETDSHRIHAPVLDTPAIKRWIEEHRTIIQAQQVTT